MPITASKGALTYLRTIGSYKNFILQFTTPTLIKDNVVSGNNTTLLINDGHSYSYELDAINFDLTNIPSISWERNVIPDILLTTGTATQTYSADNSVQLNSYANYPVGSQVVFLGTEFGGISAKTTYFVKSQISPNRITLSLTSGGATVILNNASGSMTIDKLGTRWVSGNRIRYNTNNNYWYVVATTYTRNVTYNVTGQLGYIYSIKSDGTVQNYVDIVAPRTASIPISTLDIDFIDYPLSPLSPPILYLNNQYSSTYPNYNNDSVLIRYPNASTSGTADYIKSIYFPTSNTFDNTQGFCRKNNAGETITVTNTLPPGGGRYIVVSKFNTTTGVASWMLQINMTGISDAKFYDAVIDSNDNIYVISYSGHIFKVDTNGNLVLQQKINNVFLTSIDIDNSNNLYVVGYDVTQTNIIINKLDSSLLIQYTNNLQIDPISDTLYTFLPNIRVFGDTLLISYSLFVNNLYYYGVFSRFPIDGSIPGSGTYAMTNVITAYDVIYTHATPSQTTTSITSTSVNQTTNKTITINQVTSSSNNNVISYRNLFI